MRIALSCQLVLAVVSASGCGVVQGGDRPITGINEASRLGRISIPSTADRFACATDKKDNDFAPDYCVYGKFELTEAELTEFMKSWPAETEIEFPAKDMSHFRDRKLAPWWRPQDVGSPRTAGWSSGSFSVNMLIGSGATPGKTSVYFFNFSL